MTPDELQEATESVRRTMRRAVAQLGDLRPAWVSENQAIQRCWGEIYAGRVTGGLALTSEERRRLRELATRLEEEAQLASQALDNIKFSAGAIAHVLAAAPAARS